MTGIAALDILGFILGVVAAILVGNKIKWGFLCFIVHSSCYLAIGLIDGRMGLVSTCIVFIVIDLYYFIKWHNESEELHVL